ncbi:hypothetical protein EVAR_2881_1 [Eumeta japonica]|uniref:Uncharacterized protein n=1 Tax=Eumeta variegata TaxID=151549 RepID=A0A4C1T0M5_EUMVA|nr:hypothetical protein EVAR_2881_1 [Eumeta japonica]
MTYGHTAMLMHNSSTVRGARALIKLIIGRNPSTRIGRARARHSTGAGAGPVKYFTWTMALRSVRATIGFREYGAKKLSPSVCLDFVRLLSRGGVSFTFV